MLALDQVQNPGNLAQSSAWPDWFSIPEIVCSPTTADCYNPKVVQANMGTILRVKVHYTALEPYLLWKLPGAEYSVAGLSSRGKTSGSMDPLRRRDRPDGTSVKGSLRPPHDTYFQ